MQDFPGSPWTFPDLALESVTSSRSPGMCVGGLEALSTLGPKEGGCGEKEGHSCLAHFSALFFPSGRMLLTGAVGSSRTAPPWAPVRTPSCVWGTEFVLGGAMAGSQSVTRKGWIPANWQRYLWAAPPPLSSPKSLGAGGRWGGAQSEEWEYSPCRLEDVLSESQT